MKTAIAISPMRRNVLSVATIPPAAVTASHMTRIAPRIVPMIRPMSPVCARCLWPRRRLPTGGHSPADARQVMIAGPRGPAMGSWPGPATAPDDGCAPDRAAVRCGEAGLHTMILLAQLLPHLHGT